MLPIIYADPDTARSVGEDPENAPIPELHKAMFRFTRRFVQEPWSFSRSHIDELRECGLSDADVVMWAQIAGLQSWFTMNADGSGISLEGGAVTGPVLGRERETYHRRDAYRPTPDTNGSASPPATDGAGASEFVATAEQEAAMAETRAWADARYGRLPHLLAAVSLEPGMLSRHRMALELLERPQASLPPELHALARVRAMRLNRSSWSLVTARALEPDETRFERLGAEILDDGWSDAERAVLTLATKLVRHSYRITRAEADAFRAAGLTDDAYVDAMNTVAIQTSLERMAAALGVRPEPQPLL